MHKGALRDIKIVKTAGLKITKHPGSGKGGGRGKKVKEGVGGGVVWWGGCLS